MERLLGTVVRGIRTPILQKGDNLEEIAVNSLLEAAKAEGFQIRDKDVLGITESVVARAQGNYASTDDIAQDIQQKFGGDAIGVVFPILSRNRFSVLLRGIAKGSSKVVLLLSYPADEVGNHLLDPDSLDERDINPWTDILSEEEFFRAFGSTKHPFTGIDYVQYYRSVIEEAGADCTIVFSNNPQAVLAHTTSVLVCDIHTRFRTRRQLEKGGAEKVFTLDQILDKPLNGSGYNPEFGLLGSNKATEDSVKLFPRNCLSFVENVQKKIKEISGNTIEVMVYGDGAFKDPVGKIWELADPVVSPGFTMGLQGMPNEIKIKYLADNDFAGLSGRELQEAIDKHIREKKSDLVGAMEAQGTTPRRLTDLIGSLCDLTSGSGDKGTPLVYIQGYFDNYSNKE